MSDHPTRINRDTYERSVVHGCAGPLSELATTEIRETYGALGANAWQVVWDVERGTVLRPVHVDGY